MSDKHQISQAMDDTLYDLRSYCYLLEIFQSNILNRFTVLSNYDSDVIEATTTRLVDRVTELGAKAFKLNRQLSDLEFEEKYGTPVTEW